MVIALIVAAICVYVMIARISYRAFKILFLTDYQRRTFDGDDHVMLCICSFFWPIAWAVYTIWHIIKIPIILADKLWFGVNNLITKAQDEDVL